MFPGLAYPEAPARSRISSLRRCVPKSPHARGDPPADTLSASDQLSLGKPAPPNGHPSFPSPSTFPSWRKPCGMKMAIAGEAASWERRAPARHECAWTRPAPAGRAGPQYTPAASQRSQRRLFILGGAPQVREEPV